MTEKERDEILARMEENDHEEMAYLLRQCGAYDLLERLKAICTEAIKKKMLN